MKKAPPEADQPQPKAGPPQEDPAEIGNEEQKARFVLEPYREC